MFAFLDEFQSTSSRRATITVCVPAIAKDIATLDALLDSIDAQTVKADETIVYMTGVPGPLLLLPLLRRPAVRVFTDRVRRTVGHSRNQCMARATSKFVMFLDGDDQMHPERIKMVTQSTRRGNTLILHGHSDFEPQHSRSLRCSS